PLLAMLLTQSIYTGMFLLSKAAISSGMKPYVFVAYRQAIPTLVFAPLAYFYDRKKTSALTPRLLIKIYVASVLGMHASMNLTYFAFEFATATYINAISNVVPALVFVIAVALKMERLCATERRGQAKVLGLVMCIGGAIVFTLYRGPTIYSDRRLGSSSVVYTRRKDSTIKGCLLALAAQLAWATWLLIQNDIVEEYKAHLRLMVLQCGFGSATTAIFGVAIDRNASSWRVQWNSSNIFTVVYCGIAVTGVTYTLQNWVVGKKGPVYPAVFNPLSLVMTAILSAIFYRDAIYCGSVVGGVLLVGGLYCFLWAKNLESRQEG
ncbi:hypothetical protein M569_08496, partial [Genlisea aurea]